MGTWGEGLYDDDEARDVRDAVSLLSKMPGDGDSILGLLLDRFERDENLAADGCPTFWMAVADPFSKRGLECDRAMTLALAAMESGADLADLEAREMGPRGLEARKRVHEPLRDRMANPKPVGSRRLLMTPPRTVVDAGEVYSFPTTNGTGFNAWFSSWNEAGFDPNGWGSLTILDVGRLLGWLPWAAYTPLVTNPDREPSFEDAPGSQTLFWDGVAYCAPKRSHISRMGMSLLGKVPIAREAVARLEAEAQRTPKDAVLCDWSICSGAFSRSDPILGRVAVDALLAESRTASTGDI